MLTLISPLSSSDFSSSRACGRTTVTVNFIGWNQEKFEGKFIRPWLRFCGGGARFDKKGKVQISSIQVCCGQIWKGLLVVDSPAGVAMYLWVSAYSPLQRQRDRWIGLISWPGSPNFKTESFSPEDRQWVEPYRGQTVPALHIWSISHNLSLPSLKGTASAQWSCTARRLCLLLGCAGWGWTQMTLSCSCRALEVRGKFRLCWTTGCIFGRWKLNVLLPSILAFWVS